MCEKLKILFMPETGMVGSLNACIGIASVLRDRGHHVTFVVASTWEGILENLGFLEELYSIPPRKSDSEESENSVDPISLSPLELHEALYAKSLKKGNRTIRYTHDQLKTIVAKVEPDVIVLDVCQHIPALMDSGIPWILSISIMSLSISRANVPPPFAGFPTEGDRSEWKSYEDTISKTYKILDEKFKEWLVSVGSEPVERHFPFHLKFSPYANMYMYPLELDYTAYRPNPPNFFQFDGYVTKSTEVFEIPAKLENCPGKLIYFSMGTTGFCEGLLLQKLISILSKSPNRFIISKGWKCDEIELGENMWGENNIPQLAVIPLVDLVITHGGNNTITECFYFGKPVLVLPMLFDQLDNAQRIQETGHGLALHPHRLSESELLVAIETLLADDLLQRRMKSISRRIQASNSQSKAADLVEEVANKHSKPKETLSL